MPPRKGQTHAVASFEKDGEIWQIGCATTVEWIQAGTTGGLTIQSAIPPAFESYATIVLPEEPGTPRGLLARRQDEALLALLKRHTKAQPWWLGYLETGASDVVFWDAPRVLLYASWQYVVVQAGPEQAATWRPSEAWGENWKNSELPDLMFPVDRAWLLSTLWDDAWSCLGGSAALISDLLADPVLRPRSRRVDPTQDATPPGYTAY